MTHTVPLHRAHCGVRALSADLVASRGGRGAGSLTMLPTIQVLGHLRLARERCGAHLAVAARKARLALLDSLHMLPPRHVLAQERERRDTDTTHIARELVRLASGRDALNLGVEA